MEVTKQMAQNIIEVWNQKDISALQKLYGENTTFYDPLLNDKIKGKTILGYAQGIYAAFPDLEFVVKGITTSNDMAMIEWVQQGTNTGDVMGRPATGKYIEIPAVSVVRFNEGTFVSQRDYWDLKKLVDDLFKE